MTNPQPFTNDLLLKRRDPGLDMLRGMALILMTSIHYAQSVPSTHALGEALHFYGDTAPAVFFFCFGMTIDRFLVKAPRIKWDMSVLFLYVALAHNIYRGGLLRIDFLCFLWLWRSLIQLLESRRAIPTRYYGLAIIFILIVMLRHPTGFTDLVYCSFRGWFPFVPWGLFVLMGVIYVRTPKAETRWIFAFALLLAAGIMAYLNAFGPWPNCGFEKVPVSAAYIIYLCGLSMFGSELVRAGAGRYRRLPLLPRGFEFISRNLLLATVLHYVPMGFLNPVMIHLLNRPGPWPSLARWDWAYMLVGSVISVAVTLVLVELANRVWSKIRDRKFFQFLHAHHYATATALLVPLTGIGMIKNNAVKAVFWETYLHLQLPPDSLIWVQKIFSLFTVGVMVYFALELASRRSGVRQKADDGARN